MKNKLSKLFMLTSVCSVVILSACQQEKSASHKDNIPSSVESSSSEVTSKNNKDFVESSQSSKQENSDSDLATSTTAIIETKKSDEENYKAVFDNYHRLKAYLKEGGDPMNWNLAQSNTIPLPDEMSAWVIEGALRSIDQIVYGYYDINHDGVNELFIGTRGTDGQIYVTELYYLNNGQPNRIAESFVASGGGARSGFIVYEDGSIVSMVWSSASGLGTVTHYRLPSGGQGNASVVSEIADYQVIGNSQKVSDILEITASELSLPTIIWNNFE
ncbi:hypothetical protein AB1I63_00655 [Streptococcus pneumoniae]